MGQQERLTKLETQWVLLSEKAEEYGVSTDVKEDYASSRLSHRSSAGDQVKDVDALVDRFVILTRDIDASADEEKLETEKQRMQLFEELTELSGAEMKRLIEKIRVDTSMKDSLKKEVIMASIMILSEKEPEASLALVLEIQDDFFKKSDSSLKYAIGTVVAQFAKQDPQAAVAWLKAHEEEIGGVSDEMRSQVLREAGSSLKEAASIISDLEFKNEDLAFRAIAQRVTAENVSEFFQIIRAEDGVSRDALMSLAQSPFSKDVEKAIAFLEGGNLTANEQKEFFKGLNYYDQKENVKGWLNWMVESRVLSSTVSQNLLRGWTRDDFRASGEWINTLEKGSQRNQAVGTYARTLAEHEPAAAATWVESLPEGAQRDRLRTDVYRHWEKKNPVAASAYAKRHGISQ